MRIEKRYYDLDKKEWDEIMEEVRSEKEERTPEDEKMTAQNAAFMLGEILKKYDESAQDRKQVPAPDRIQRFRKLSSDALCAAKLLGCNIIIADDQISLGKITLEAESFILLHSKDHHLNQIFSSLFLWASDVFVSAEPSGLCKIKFLYPLCQETRT